ncbi:MAG: hypothetical protein IJK89_00880 [Clostridia bacterium]|nr:hypothetical protein [Clostridia bacterium]
MKKMKGVLALLLAFIFLCGIAPMSLAAEERSLTNWGSRVPVVLVGGDGEPLADQDGNEIFRFEPSPSSLKAERNSTPG